jgi:acetyltransferase-like isoleucine patch superfamily enzyme
MTDKEQTKTTLGTGTEADAQEMNSPIPGGAHAEVKKPPFDGAHAEPKTELQMALTDARRSALDKYREMVLGDTGLWALIKYEVIMAVCNAAPGAPGYLLRKILYPKLFAKVGRGTVFGRNMTIRHPSKISIGENSIIDDLVVLDAKGKGNKGITIGDNVIIARNTVVSCKGGDIDIGDNSNISLNCMIHSEKSVTIGKNNLWAAYCYIIGGGNHEFDRVDIPIVQQGSRVTGIVMDEDIWLGADVRILDGCHLGKGVVVGAGSLVTKDIPDYHLAAGMPARVIRDRRNKPEKKSSEKE